MNRINSVLIVILIVQLLLTVIVFSSNDSNNFTQSSENLMTVKLDTVDTITITNAEKQQLNLHKVGKQWLLPDYFNVAVDTEKFDRTSQNLLAMKTSWPAATSEDAAPRFEVADDKYQTRITFKQQNNIIETLYLGKSPSFRKVHVRRADDKEIYNISFNTYELSTQYKDWMAKDLLKLDAATLTRVKTTNLELTHKDSKWQLENLKDNEQTNSDSSSNLINKLSNLVYTEIMGITELQEYGLNKADFTIELTQQAGTIVKLTFAKSQGDDYIGKSSAHPYYFKISQYSLQPIIDITREQLISKNKREDGSSTENLNENQQLEP